MRSIISPKALMIFFTASSLLTALFIPFLTYIFSGISMYINFTFIYRSRAVYLLNTISVSAAFIVHTAEISGI